MFRLISVYPSDFPGNVFTRAVARERGYRASIQPQKGCIEGAVRQRVREGVSVRCWPGVFASLPEQRRAFLLVKYNVRRQANNH
jgi:hypothetical protein